MYHDLDKLRKYSASFEQFADAKLSTLEEGSGRGSRIISVTNGSGLAFTVTPDRAMDIVDCSFRGIPLVFRSPVGYASPARYEAQGINWLRNWPAGLLTTAGLRNAGNPNGEFGLHGRIGNQTAEDVSIRRGVDPDGIYRIRLNGTVRESMMFGENLRMKRTIQTALGVNEIRVEDEVENLSCREDVIQFIYHCNFGYPLVSPATVFSAKEHDIIPRNEHAASAIADWNRFPEPSDDFEEMCYFHKLPPDSDGNASISIFNPEIGIRMTISYPVENLPHLVEWKNALSGLYVLGLEPSNACLEGRAGEIANGTQKTLYPGQSVKFAITFKFDGK